MYLLTLAQQSHWYAAWINGLLPTDRLFICCCCCIIQIKHSLVAKVALSSIIYLFPFFHLSPASAFWLICIKYWSAWWNIDGHHLNARGGGGRGEECKWVDAVCVFAGRGLCCVSAAMASSAWCLMVADAVSGYVLAGLLLYLLLFVLSRPLNIVRVSQQPLLPLFYSLPFYYKLKFQFCCKSTSWAFTTWGFFSNINFINQ